MWSSAEWVKDLVQSFYYSSVGIKTGCRTCNKCRVVSSKHIPNQAHPRQKPKEERTAPAGEYKDQYDIFRTDNQLDRQIHSNNTHTSVHTRNLATLWEYPFFLSIVQVLPHQFLSPQYWWNKSHHFVLLFKYSHKV